MGIANVIASIKEVHREYVLLVKIGSFYYCYGKDTYILSYLLKYKINIIEKNIYSCSFPKVAYSKVIATLEDKKINYLIVDKKDNYNVEEKSNNKNLNRYKEIYNKAKDELVNRFRIEKIYKYLLNNIEDKNIISEMEKLIDERRKI